MLSANRTPPPYDGCALCPQLYPQAHQSQRQSHAAEGAQVEPIFLVAGPPCPEGPDGQQNVDRQAKNLGERFWENIGEEAQSGHNQCSDKDNEPDDLAVFFS